jgi:hypothetical protein
VEPVPKSSQKALSNRDMRAPTRMDKPKKVKAPLPKPSHCETAFARVFSHSLSHFLPELSVILLR